MKLDFQVVNAFVDDQVAFSGNPAAVIVLPHDDAISDVTKQKIATQFNLSETVYVSPKWTEHDSDKNRNLSKDEWVIRWFTPTCEAPICGHATMATSHVLFHSVLPETRVIKYQTNYNTRLQATREGELVILDFFLNDPGKVNASWVKEIERALVGEQNTDKVEEVQLAPNLGYLLVRLRDDVNREFIREVRPNCEQLLKVDTGNALRVGVILTQKASIERDHAHFTSRFFAPWLGVNEDPVCGSAHTVLAPYWHRAYQAEHGQQIEWLYAWQVSSRTGRLHCQFRDTRVFLKGRGHVFCTGTLYL